MIVELIIFGILVIFLVTLIFMNKELKATQTKNRHIDYNLIKRCADTALSITKSTDKLESYRKCICALQTLRDMQEKYTKDELESDLGIDIDDLISVLEKQAVNILTK
jgi:hypothetical protein